MANQKTDETVTLGITAFNCEDTIEKAVLSAISQDYINCEILIVDDCSSDRTYEIITALSSKYPEITTMRHKRNCGVATTRNSIIQNSKTDFIAFFDDDDESESHRIKLQLNAIRQAERDYKSQIVVCHSARYVEYASNDILYQPALGQAARKTGISGPEISEAILTGTKNINLKGACPTCVQMARVSTYKLLNGFDENLTRSEDTDFSIRAAERGAIFIGLDAPLVLQRMTNGDEKRVELEATNWRYLINKHRDIIERKMPFRVAKDWLDIRFSWISNKYKDAIITLLKLFLKHPLHTSRRIWLSIPNLRLNLKMSKFYVDKSLTSEK